MLNNFLEKAKDLLLNRKKDIKSEMKSIAESDPFMQEYKQDGFRNVDQLEEEVADTTQHDTVVAMEKDLDAEQTAIRKSMEKIEKGTYGICEKCGKQIEKERLEIIPTATTCVKCSAL